MTNPSTNFATSGSNWQSRAIRVAIFGSCVSRDTCEHLPDALVVGYVARQSMITALHPVGKDRFSVEDLESTFQARMFAGDQSADGVTRISRAHADVILIDLIDERRGVWQFPDGSYLTNSIEAARTGIDEWAPREGARHIAFGTDEHYTLWEQGMRKVMKQLTALPAVLIFLDIAWAEAHEGSRLHGGIRTTGGRAYRRMRRGMRQMCRALGRGDPLVSALKAFVLAPLTPAEQLAKEGRRGNLSFARYRRALTKTMNAAGHQGAPDSEARHIIARSRHTVRTSMNHKWGPAPYHYRNSDYESLATEIVQVLLSGEIQ